MNFEEWWDNLMSMGSTKHRSPEALANVRLIAKAAWDRSEKEACKKLIRSME